MSHLSSVLRPAQLGPNARLEDALDAVRKHLRMPVAYLSAFEGDEVVFKEVASESSECFLQKGDRRHADGSYCQGVLNGTLPQMIPDTRENPVALSLAVTHKAPVGAVISIPILRRDGSTYGMFCCLSPKPMPSLNDRDHEVMTMFASLAADAVNEDLEHREELDRIRLKVQDTIRDRNFETVLQPIFHLDDGRIAGAEALSRFRATPYRSPDRWFADARKVDLEHSLELATFAKALELISELPRGQTLSLNASANLLGSSILQPLIDGPYADRITIEMTEHEGMGDVGALAKAIKDLRNIGVRFAIDDLGAGHSGLSTVLQLKPDVLKMDRTLVRGVHLDPASQALVASLVYFAKRIDAQLVAEGIETWDEAAMLCSLGVDFGQGFLLGKPARLGDYRSAVAASEMIAAEAVTGIPESQTRH